MAKKKVFPPGEYLADELAARGWTQANLAKILDRPFQHVNLLVHDKRRINAEIASELAAAFGTSAELWLNLQAAWDAYNAPAPSKEIAKRAAAMSAA
jgi:HTH-type transcriptional regulator / antitoxin HigA